MLPFLLALTQSLQQRMQQHPTRFMAGVAIALSLIGGGAVAVVNLAPDASQQPLRQVVESVSSLSLPSLDTTKKLQLFRTDTTRSSDTAESLLSRLGVNDAEATAFLRNTPLARQQLLGRAGRVVSAEADENHRLLRLVARWGADNSDQFTRWTLQRQDGGLTQSVENAPLTVTTRLGSGTIQTSLFAATDDANIPDNVATQLADVFAGDIDFQRALRKGDRFSVVYESLEADGEALRTGRVLSAEFVNAGKTLQAFWFQEPGSKGGYYNADGKSLRHAYLA